MVPAHNRPLHLWLAHKQRKGSPPFPLAATTIAGQSLPGHSLVHTRILRNRSRMPPAGAITGDLDNAIRPILGLDIICAVSDAWAGDARGRLYHGARFSHEWRQGRRRVLGLSCAVAGGACASWYTHRVGV